MSTGRDCGCGWKQGPGSAGEWGARGGAGGVEWGRGGGAGGEAGRQGAGLGPSLALVAPAGTGVSLKCHVRSAPAPVLEIEVTET